MRSDPSFRLTTLWLVLTLATFTAITLPAAAPAKTKPTCKRSNSSTVQENRVARVFMGRVGGRGGDRRLFGCWKRTGSTQLLTRRFDRCVPRGVVNLIRLHGRFAAFYSRPVVTRRRRGCPQINAPIRHVLHVINLRNRSRHVTEVVGRPAAGRLLLNAWGAIAWPSWLPQNQIEVLVVDDSGSVGYSRDSFGDFIRDTHGRATTSLDSGPIRPESLHLEEALHPFEGWPLRAVRWVKEGQGDGYYLDRLIPFMR